MQIGCQFIFFQLQHFYVTVLVQDSKLVDFISRRFYLLIRMCKHLNICLQWFKENFKTESANLLTSTKTCKQAKLKIRFFSKIPSSDFKRISLTYFSKYMKVLLESFFSFPSNFHAKMFSREEFSAFHLHSPLFVKLYWLKPQNQISRKRKIQGRRQSTRSDEQIIIICLSLFSHHHYFKNPWKY